MPVPAVQVVQKNVRDPQAQFTDTVVDVPVVVQHQAPMTQEVQIQVFKGERTVTKEHNLLCILHFDEIPLAPRGAPQIEATFDIDGNEDLNVSAQK